MNTILKEILEEKKREIERLKMHGISSNGHHSKSLVRDFKGAISVSNRIGLIAEIKFASPSAGIIREKGDPIHIGRMYEAMGAAAISLLTDKRFFNGDIRHLEAVKSVTTIPILRKDFIVDATQVLESYEYGADAILLISRILAKKKLGELIGISRELGLACLVEVHDRPDLQKAIDCGAEIVGINNRDLNTFDVNFRNVFYLAPGACRPYRCE